MPTYGVKQDRDLWWRVTKNGRVIPFSKRWDNIYMHHQTAYAVARQMNKGAEIAAAREAKIRKEGSHA